MTAVAMAVVPAVVEVAAGVVLMVAGIASAVCAVLAWRRWRHLCAIIADAQRLHAEADADRAHARAQIAEAERILRTARQRVPPSRFGRPS